MLVWSPWGLVGLTAGLLAWAAAVFISRTAPDPRVRFRFAALLFLEGVMIQTSIAGPPVWLTSEVAYRGAAILHVANDWLLIAAYLPAVSVVVDSPLLHPFRRGPGLAAAVAVGVGGCALVFVAPDWFVGEIGPVSGEFGATMIHEVGPVWRVASMLLTASYTYGLIATAIAWRRAQGPIARRQAGILTMAFGTRDLFWGGMFLILTFAANSMSFAALGLLVQLAAGALLVYVVLTAYGVASSNLLDIELRAKWTVERGTVAAVFVAVFFVVSEATQAVLSERLGPFIGLLVMGALVFVLAPLHRAGQRLADAALPGVQDTPEYLTFRRLQIYAEALASALEDGQISAVERAVLKRLASSLDLDPDEAANLEAELVEQLAP